MSNRKPSARSRTLRPPKPRAVALGIHDWRVPLHSHVSYLWTSPSELAEAAGFLEAGLRGRDHGLLVGSPAAREPIRARLAEGGFDLEALKAGGRLTLIEGAPSADALFDAIAADCERAVVGGAPLVRLLGTPSWGEPGWPDSASWASFEARLTGLARRHPCVMVCAYDLRSLSGTNLDHAGPGDHPLVVAAGRLIDGAHSVPGKVLVTSLLYAVQTVAERERAERALAESEARFARIFQASPVALGMSTIEEGRILDVNQSWLEMFGYRRDEVIGRTNAELKLTVRPQDREATIRRVRADGIVRNLEIQVRRKSGELLDLIVAAVPVELPGEGPSWISAQLDITARKEAEAERERLIEAARAAHERLSALSRRLVQVQETERAGIARELHDEVGQLLTGLRLMIDTGDLETAGRPERMRSIVDELITRVRDLSMSLRPPMLDALGLLPALLWQIERFEAQTGIHVVFRHGNLQRRFPAEMETAAFRVVQEGLTNVARHAGVEKARVEVTAAPEHLRARIEDHGRGFDVEGALAGASSGLAGMYERSRLLGGRLTIVSSAGSGTRIDLELPLAYADAGRAES